MKHAKKCGWKTIQLLEDLLSVVDEMVSHRELGYTSRSEFVKEAVRLRIEMQRNLLGRSKAAKRNR